MDIIAKPFSFQKNNKLIHTQPNKIKHSKIDKPKKQQQQNAFKYSSLTIHYTLGTYKIESIHDWYCHCHTSKHPSHQRTKTNAIVHIPQFPRQIIHAVAGHSLAHTAHTHTQIFPLRFTLQEVRGQADVTVQLRFQKVCPTDFPPPAVIDISVDEREKKEKVNIYNPKEITIDSTINLKYLS